MNASTEKQISVYFRKYLPILMVFAISLLLSQIAGTDRYAQRIILLVLLWATMCNGFNLISGYGGQVVFGYMMFVGTGAYTSILLFKFLGITPWLGMWVGALVAVIFAFIIGLPTLRLRGHFFAVATVAFPLMTFPILNHLGLEELGIPFIGEGAGSMQFSDIRYYVLIATIFLVLVLLLIQKIESSRLGFALKALKQNETAAEGMGIDTYRAKMTAFMLASAIAAIGGTLYAVSILYVLTTHAVFGLFIIVRILGITIVGGMGTLWGPVIAAAILVPLGEFLNAQFGARLPGVQDVVYGAALVISIIYVPEGIWGRITKALRERNRKMNISGEMSLAVSSGAGNPTFAGAFSRQDFPKIDDAGNQDALLKIKGVSVSFGGVQALKDLDIEVPPGKLFGIIGPNGAGKTSLFNVINGYLKPDEGSLIFDGKDASSLKPNQVCKMGIGRTFQVAQIFHNLTVIENIMVGAFAKTRDAAEAQAISERVAKSMGLAGRAGDIAAGLNMWETKMVEISRALATQPKLLLLDEPMSGLNPEETVQIGEIIKSIAASGITVIVIEHVVQRLIKIADFMVGLVEGQKVAEGSPEQVISNVQIIEAYLGAKWRKRYVKG
jgi:branched-chain amino acid transport system permease protein